MEKSAQEILDQYGDMVFRTAYTMVKNPHDAEDIAQDVFVSLVRVQPKFESDEHQKAWLLRVTINRSKVFCAAPGSNAPRACPIPCPMRPLPRGEHRSGGGGKAA